ncbi:MAG TPA: CHAT domain-containing tetratricopeptide repeat protein [Bryobacteraceae bacterium]|nr:CHAT domain-containing tetratricopeptide repeat protein [Bryobacteraceae bacterium]
MWLPQAVCMLSVLSLTHSGLLVAGQSQQNTSGVKQIDALIAEGKKLRSAGHFAQAIEKFTDAAHSAHDLSDLDRESVALRESSICHASLYQYREALELAQRSRDLAVRANDQTASGAAASVLSSIYRLLGDHALAEKESEYAIRELAESPRRDFLTKALLGFAGLNALDGRNEEALTSANRAVAVARKAGLAGLEAWALDFSGILLVLENTLPEAEQALNKAASIQLQIKDIDNLAVTHEHLAELELKKGNYATALKYVDQAFAAPSPSFKINPQYYPIHVRGQILLGLGRTRDALLEFRRAVDAANEWRSDALPGDVTSTLTVAQLYQVYEDYAELAATLSLKSHDLALARAGLEALTENRAASLREQLTFSLDRNLRLPPEYFALVSSLQREQAHVTLEEKPQEHEAKLREMRLQLSDLENKIGLEALDNSPQQEKNPHKNSLRSIQTRLSGTEVLLSFCLGKRQSFMWAVTGDDVHLYELPDESTIGQQAKAFSAAARTGQDTLGPGRALSQSLFGRLNQDAWRKREWLIVADGALLDGVPFSALPRAGDGTPLSAAHSLRLLPSELLLLQPTAAAPSPVFVGIADPIYNLADSRRAGAPLVQARRTGKTTVLARLAGSDREVRAAAAASGLAGTELLSGAKATGDVLRHAAAKRPTVVHFAVHVVSPEGRPQEAALALSLTSDGIPELLTPEAVASYRVPGSLVVMSGCDSEQGKTFPSAGLIGLSRAWLLAGAAAVIVSAWPTPDDSGEFFSSFYAHFQKDSGTLAKRASLALQEAQLDMQRGGGYRSSPSLWAAYSIISKE